jgi:hypothetical protein
MMEAGRVSELRQEIPNPKIPNAKEISAEEFQTIQNVKNPGRCSWGRRLAAPWNLPLLKSGRSKSAPLQLMVRELRRCVYMPSRWDLSHGVCWRLNIGV